MSQARSGVGCRRFHNSIRKHGPEAFTVLVLRQVETQEEAKALEIQLIAELGTLSPKGYNLTKGGDGSAGFKHSPETRKKLLGINKGNKVWLGRHHSPETRRKLSEVNKGKKHSAESKRRIREGTVRALANPEVRAKLGSGPRGRKFSAEHKRKIGEAHRGKEISAEHRGKVGEANSRRVWTAESRKRMSKAVKSRKVSAETRRKMSEANKRRGPEYRARLSEAIRASWIKRKENQIGGK